MSHNVLKLSKQYSHPNSSNPNITPVSNSILQLQHHTSTEFSRERESLANLKDFQINPSNSQPGKKKLAYLLDPSKDLYSSLSPTYTSPKSFLGNSITNKLKPSGSSFENSNLNLISPKDLVRLAMNKHKSKPVVKKIPTAQPQASLQRNARKSLCVRTGSGEGRSQKRDRSNSKLGYSGVEDSMLSKTCQSMVQDKSAKLKRMKLIYNDMTPAEIARLAKSTIYTPNEASGRIRHGTVTPNRSNSGLLWPASPSGNISLINASNKKNKLCVAQVGSDKVFYGKENEEDKADKVEKGHVKRGSVEQINNFFKESKPLAKQSKRSDKKSLQPRQMTSGDNLKTSSFSRLMSNSSINQETITRAKSPTMAFNPEEEEEEMSDVLEVSEYKAQEVKPREEFITDLKNWVNDIVKPQEEVTTAAPKKNTAVTEKVKEVQEGMLTKLREVLDNDEFVRREDYERLYMEKESVEEELDSLKEENAQLRAMLYRMQQENEARELQEREARKASNSMNSNCYDSTIIQPLQESLARQNKELEDLKRRENIVQDVLKMIWRAGNEIGDLHNPNMMKENMQMHHKQDEYEQEVSNYTVESGQPMPSAHQEPLNQNYIKTHEKYAKNLKPIGEKIYKEEGEGEDSEAYSRNLIALSDLGDSEAGFSNRQLFETMAKSQNALVNIIKKTGSNPKSTAASSPLFSAKLIPQNYVPSKAQDKLKIDLTGLGGNSQPKSNVYSSQSSLEKANKNIVADNGQSFPLGFHEEFMAKLDEFSQSWRQDALAYQKF